jgi:hypothetical protein
MKKNLLLLSLFLIANAQCMQSNKSSWLKNKFNKENISTGLLGASLSYFLISFHVTEYSLTQFYYWKFKACHSSPDIPQDIRLKCKEYEEIYLKCRDQHLNFKFSAARKETQKNIKELQTIYHEVIGPANLRSGIESKR